MKTIEQRIQEYWNRQPCNIRHGQSPVGTLEFFQEVTAKRRYAEPHMAEFAGFHLWQGRRVLETGCGIGTDAADFAKHGADYVGFDYSEESVKLTRQRFEVEGLSGHIFQGDATDPETYADLGEFDLVYSCGVLHHFPNIERAIDNIYRVLKPGGELRLLVYAQNSWKQAMIKKGLDQYEAQSGCPFAKSYTQQDMYTLLGDRFLIERIRQDHCFMYNVELYKQGIYELEPWFAAMPEAMREAVKEYLGWHLMVKARKL